jgi:hypothetical protein
MTPSLDFSATDSALGYLYQVRLALLLALQKRRQNECFAVYLETLDDVVFENSGSSIELLQLKHHCNRTAILTDASPDLWKSLRIWMEGRADRSIPEDAKFYLITTSNIRLGSSASYLTVEHRNESEALKFLQITAASSKNQTNVLSYKLFQGLSPDEKVALVRAITIIPNTPNISEVEEKLHAEVRFVVKNDQIKSFLKRLEGWWYRRSVEQLTNQDLLPILSEELENEIDDLREQFKLNALPVDQDLIDKEIDPSIYENRVFVQQVKLTGIRHLRILAAIRDYYRAFEQRSRWIREDLLFVGDLDKYEKFLQEEWELYFYRVADEMGDSISEEAKRKAAQEIYAWVEQTCYPIRDQVKHPSLTRGSFHILSDQLKVGWHPDFQQRLQKILEPQVLL